MRRIAIFASGGGSNAQKILEYFKNHREIEVGLIVTNNANAGVLQHANSYGVNAIVLTKENLRNDGFIIDFLKSAQIDVVVLAGYLKLIGPQIIGEFPDRILNIHPSLLPKYGGIGMYGINVHRAVKEQNDLVSGPTIHLVSKEYDKGRILLQKEIPIASTDSPKQIAAKVLEVEHAEYAQVIEGYINEYYKRS